MDVRFSVVFPWLMVCWILCTTSGAPTSTGGTTQALKETPPPKVNNKDGMQEVPNTQPTPSQAKTEGSTSYAAPIPYESDLNLLRDVLLAVKNHPEVLLLPPPLQSIDTPPPGKEKGSVGPQQGKERPGPQRNTNVPGAEQSTATSAKSDSKRDPETSDQYNGEGELKKLTASAIELEDMDLIRELEEEKAHLQDELELERALLKRHQLARKRQQDKMAAYRVADDSETDSTGSKESKGGKSYDVKIDVTHSTHQDVDNDNDNEGNGAAADDNESSDNEEANLSNTRLSNHKDIGGESEPQIKQTNVGESGFGKFKMDEYHRGKDVPIYPYSSLLPMKKAKIVKDNGKENDDKNADTDSDTTVDIDANDSKTPGSPNAGKDTVEKGDQKKIKSEEKTKITRDKAEDELLHFAKQDE